jgi:hypothetical protein
VIASAAPAGDVIRRWIVSAQWSRPPRISALMANAAAMLLLMPHLLYPVAKKILPPPRGSLPKKGIRLVAW